jgi:hypothetical protein
MAVLLKAIERAPTSRLSAKNTEIDDIDFMSGLREPFRGCNMGKTDDLEESDGEWPDAFIPSTASQLTRLAAAWIFTVPIPCIGVECCQKIFSTHHGWARVNPTRYLIPPPTCVVNRFRRTRGPLAKERKHTLSRAVRPLAWQHELRRRIRAASMLMTGN